MKTLVVAPHPDDEMLGCGGTLLRRKAEGASVAWLIVTGMRSDAGFPANRIVARGEEIDRVRELAGFDEVFNLELPATRLDVLPKADLVAALAAVFRKFEPEEVFLPHPGDAHSDHAAVFDAGAACTKWFRYPSVRRVLTYETISETDFGLGAAPFQPNVYLDITSHLDRKIEIMSVYASEMGRFPFPRSVEAIRAMAMTRGATAGFGAAEAFCLMRERV